MHVELIEHWDRIPLNRDEWNGLASRNDVNTIFQSYEWFHSWWSVYGTNRELFFLVLREGSTVLGFVPWMIERRRFGLRRLEFVGGMHADYQDFIIVPERKAEALELIAKFLRSRADRWDHAFLRNLPMTSSTFALLPSKMGAAGLGTLTTRRVECPTLLIEGHEKEVSRLIDRYSLRRPVKQLERTGPVAFRKLQAGEDVERYLPTFFEQHVARRNGTRARSPFTQERAREFFRVLAARVAAAGWLHFSVLECASQPVAFHYGFDYNGSLCWYKPSFDPRFARQSPGLALIRCLIADALAGGRRELDFTIGAEAFKDRFSNERRTNAEVKIVRSPALFAAARVADTAYWTAVGTARKVRTLARRVRGAYGNASSRAERGNER